MYDYAFVQLRLGDRPGRAVILRDRLPQVGARLTIGGACWEVVSAESGSYVCAPCA